MINNNYKYFSDYLKSFNVHKTSEIEWAEKIDDDSVIKQLIVISDFSKIASNYKGFESRNFPNKTGIYMEEMKVLLKRYRRYIETIKQKNDLSITEEFILNDNDELLNRGERSVENIRFEDYLNILKRSMEASEICIGNTNFDNITRIDGEIYVKQLNNISYNFIEMDAFQLLKKIKRRNIKIDYDKIIEEFSDYNGLNYYSEKLIKSLLSFPYEYFKWCNNYRTNRKKFSEEEYLKRIAKAKTKDIKSLI